MTKDELTRITDKNEEVKKLTAIKEQVFSSRKTKTITQLRKEDRETHQKLADTLGQPITVVDLATTEKVIIEPTK